MLNAKDQEILEAILKKNPEDLDLEERKTLRARESYLNNEQRRVFKTVLTVDENPKKEEEAPAEKPAKKKEDKPKKETLAVNPEVEAKKEEAPADDFSGGEDKDPDA